MSKIREIVSEDVVITKEEYQETELNSMQYKKDKHAYMFTLLGLAVNCVYFILLYTNNNPGVMKFTMGISVLYNLVFMLIVFLSAENVKFFKKTYSYVLLGVGIAQFIRIAVLPLSQLNNGLIDGGQFAKLIVCLILSGVLLIAGAVVCYINSTKLENYKKSLEAKGE